MPFSARFISSLPTRRQMITIAGAGATAAMAARPAFAQQECRVGPPPHEKRPRVFLDYDQMELDAAYFQPDYEPNFTQVAKRYASNSEITRARLGQPQRIAYGPTEIEKLDIYRTKPSNAPIFVFIHGGAWRVGLAKTSAFLAETFVNAGAHYVVPDFVWVQDAGGSLMPMADQVRRAVAWVYKNAKSFGGDPSRIYVGGHSSGGHLAGVVLTTDWQKDFGLPANMIKGGVCLSGMYDLTPVRLSARSSYVKFDDAMVEALSSQRHLEQLHAPLIVAYGTYETPEFQRQSRDFAAAVKAAGKPVQLIVAENYSHMEMPETLANPYDVTGYPTLQMMKLGRA
jgi:arylformamidase